MSSPRADIRLTPFSYVILVLVGRGGAGPHDLRRMSERGRVYWDAAPSQWYAEPKRLAALGLLSARKVPGQTNARTHYELTDDGRAAVAEWVRTPSPLPRIQNEPIVRLLAADLVAPDAVREGLEPIEAAVAEGREALESSREVWAGLGPRARLLEVNARFALDLLDLQRAWLEEARRVLSGR